MSVEQKRWLNPTQPQTLHIAVLLLYFNAAFTLISGGLLSPIFLVLAAGEVAGGFGVANERKWGYILAVVVAIFPLALLVLLIGLDGFGAVVSTGVITLMFEIALVALLLHPQSRSYQRIWFK